MERPEWDWQGLWRGLPKADKPLLQIFIGMALLSGLWGVGGWLWRHDFSEALVPFVFQEEAIEPIVEKAVRYRSYLIEAPVRWAYELRAADVLIPAVGILSVGWLCIVLGWGAILTAATRMQGFGPYLLFFAWVAWVYLSGMARHWAGADPFYVVSLGLALVPLLPGFLIQNGLWRLPLRATAGLLSVLVAFVLGLPALWKGVVVFHDAVAYPGIVAFAAILIGLLQAGIALSTWITYFLSRAKAHVGGYAGLALAAVTVVSVLAFFPSEQAYTLAIFLGVGGMLVGFVGLQPYYPVWGESFRQPAAFFWGWAGLLLIALGSLGYHGWNHQDLFAYRIGEVARAVLIAALPAMTLYLGTNFWPLWKAGKMQYWELHKSTRIPLALVYFLQVGSIVWSEARADWPTARLPARLYAVLQAESALVRGDWKAAEVAYHEAALFLPYEAKLNYNLGRLEAQDPQRAERAAERYDRALLSKPFLPAALQASLVWLALDRPVRAVQVLQSYVSRFGGEPEVYNQLAFAFYKVGQVDSAAYYWKAAIGAAPSEARYYAHLALLYARYDRPAWAAKVARTLWTHSTKTQESVAENLTYLRVCGILDTLPAFSVRTWNGQWLGQEGDTGAVGRFVGALRRRDLLAAQAFISYFQEHDPELAPRLARQLAVALAKEGFSRKAAEIFLSASSPVDSLYAGYALADGGCLEAAYALISRLWVSYPDLETVGRREAALLLAASGHLSEASLLDPPSQWKDSDYLRFAQYAYRRQDIQTLVAVLRPWVDAGAAYDEPYAWVAQLFLRQKDTAGAIENISAGIGRVPASVRLRVLRGEIAYSQGRFSEAQAWADSTRLYLRSREDSLLWYDLLLRLKPAPSMIEEVANRFPTYMAGQTAWIRHLLATGRKEEAYQRSSRLLDIDPYDPELWAVYGEAAAAMGLSEEADFARKKPDPCPSAL